MLMTHAALAALAMQCVAAPASVPLVVAIAEHESGGKVDAVHLNANGTRDYGLGQINDSNFAMLSLLLKKPVDARTILNPCTNLRAAEAVLLVRYNGQPPP